MMLAGLVRPSASEGLGASVHGEPEFLKNAHLEHGHPFAEQVQSGISDVG